MARVAEPDRPIPDRDRPAGAIAQVEQACGNLFGEAQQVGRERAFGCDRPAVFAGERPGGLVEVGGQGLPEEFARLGSLEESPV